MTNWDLFGPLMQEVDEMIEAQIIAEQAENQPLPVQSRTHPPESTGPYRVEDRYEHTQHPPAAFAADQLEAS